MLKRMILFATVAFLCCPVVVMSDAIHDAVDAGDVETVRRILVDDPGAVFARAQNEFRDQPIHFAARNGSVEIARMLLEAGADVDAGDSDNSTALGIAALFGHGEMAALLIEMGADVNHRDRKADCPLSFAVSGRNEAIIQQLLDAEADLYYRSTSGETLLHTACSRGVVGFVNHLLDHGADLNARSENGATPLAHAAMAGQTEIMTRLLESGASPSSGESGDVTPLIMATWRNQVEAARVLLERGAPVDDLGHNGNTPLLSAAENCSAEMVTLLLVHNAAVNHVNEDGATALVLAAAGGHHDRVKALLKAKADPNVGTDAAGRATLHLAAMSGSAPTVGHLLAAGANVNATGPTGESALHLARYYGHTEAADKLADAGAVSAGPGATDRSLAALGDVESGAATIWFLGHSGWAVKTQNHLLVFDYFPEGNDPPNPALCNGRINPSEIADSKVAVFASHHHRDHFDPIIFEWRDQVADITYFLGLRPQDAPDYVFMPTRMEESFGDIKVTTIYSTDAGVGEVVQVDGLTIFHPGDHANGRIGLMREFTDEIDFIAERGIRPDICFMGIRGCSLGRPPEVKEGIAYTLATLEPKVFIPMHAGAQGHLYREFTEEMQADFPAIQMVAADNRGDHFTYANGTIRDPKIRSIQQAMIDGIDEQASASR